MKNAFMDQNFRQKIKDSKKCTGLYRGENIYIGNLCIYEYYSPQEEKSTPILPELGLFNPFFDSKVEDTDLP